MDESCCNLGSPTTIAVNRTGRYVRVQLAGTNYLSLAELKVSGSALTATPTLTPTLTPMGSPPPFVSPTPVTGLAQTVITQLRLRFQTDDNDSIADFLRFYSGNAIAANRLVLVIEYYVP